MDKSFEEEPGFSDYEFRLQRALNLKMTDFQNGDRLRHVILASQFTRGMNERLCRLADRIRMLSKSAGGRRFLITLLPDKRAMLYFTQPSTRTFLSFAAACQILGLQYNEVRDPAVSSESKGESPLDSMRMFSSYFDMVIMRSQIASFAECCAYMMNDLHSNDRRSVPIVNAGSGKDEHPTQALLDIYTIERAFTFSHERDSSQWTRFNELRAKYPTLQKGIEGKTIGFCGDIRRGRTVRSLAQLLTLYEGVRMIFITPPHESLSLAPDLRTRLIDAGVKITEAESFDTLIDGVPVIEALDCLYMTRIQTEHDSPKDREDFKQIDFAKYKLSKPLVARMKEYAAILHPFPRDKNFGEIPTVIDHDERSHYFRQARNGMFVRAALLAHLFDVDNEITDYYETYTKHMPLTAP